MKPRPILLLHPLFIFSIILLFTNDLYFKYEYANWFTGKLSDFAGMFAFPIFLTTLLPVWKKIIYILSGLFFIWWKSELSTSFINSLNEWLPFTFGRIIDYTDLIALIMLLPAYFLKSLPIKHFYYRKAYINSILLFCPFVFCNTSMPRHTLYYPNRHNEIRIAEQYVSSKTEEELLQKFELMGIDCRKDSVRYYPVHNYDFYYNIRSANDSSGKWQYLPNNKDSTLFIRRADSEFYVISHYILGEDTLFNVEFTIYKNNRRKKPTSILLESFQTNNIQKYNDFYYGKIRKKYKRHFRELFN